MQVARGPFVLERRSCPVFSWLAIVWGVVCYGGRYTFMP